MKKIIFSLAIIGMVAGVVAGGTWAYFTNQAEVSGNTFATGSADLSIRGYGTVESSWGTDSVDFTTEWDSLYPGWEESYDIRLRNDSTSEIGLDVVPFIEITNNDHDNLRHILTMKFVDEDENTRSPEMTLADWRNNEDALEYIDNNDNGERWSVTFRWPETGENQNHLQNSSSIAFNLIFDGIQQNESPLTRVTNIDTGYSRSTDIQDVIDNANSGDTILVPKGEYVGDLSIDIESLTIKSDDSYWGVATLKDSLVEITGDNVLFENFKMREYEVATGGNPVVNVNAENVTVNELDLYMDSFVGNQPYEIRVQNNAHGAQVLNSVIDRGFIGGHPAISLGGADNVLIEGNRIAENGASAIGGDMGENLVLRNNIVYNGYDEGIWISGSDEDITIEGNIIHNYSIGDPGSEAIKIVSAPASVNGVATHSLMADEILTSNPGVESVYLEWRNEVKTQ